MSEDERRSRAPFDRKRVALARARAVRAARAAGGAGGAAFLMGRAAEELAERLAAVTREFEVAVDMSGGDGTAAAALAAAPNVGRVVRGDSLVPALPGPANLPRVVLDEEALPFRDGALDLVVSLLGLQVVNDLPGALVQIRRALKPDGLFLATLPAGDTLAELRASLIAAETEATGGARPRVAPFAPLQALAGLLQRAGFALPVADVDRVTVRYPDMFALLKDLRAMGATGPLADPDASPARRALFARAAAHYAATFADADGRVRATFDLAHLSAWAPSESQPKPARPGSARARLADALGTVEHGAGEAAAPRADGGGNGRDP